MVRNRKYPVSPLNFCLYPMALKEINHTEIIVSVKCAVQKLRVCYYVPKQIVYLTGICDIASALSCDKQFFPQLFILL